MTPIAVYDRLSFRENQGDEAGFVLACRSGRRGSPLPPTGGENLAGLAVERLAAAAGREPTGRLSLVKTIPIAAGMGGGSSDAAAALLLANSVWGLGYSFEQLVPLAASLGSDVPFFLESGPALCRGRGEVVTRLPAKPRLPLVVVKPAAGVSTPAAYAALGLSPTDCFQTPSARSTSRIQWLIEAWQASSWARLSRVVSNGLQAAAENLCSAITAVRQAVERLGVVAHAMTGSGSAYFAICRSDRHARHVAVRLRSQRLGTVFVTATSR